MRCVMMQAFEWFCPDDSNHYRKLLSMLDELQQNGIDDLWLPPVFKATGTNDVGYGIYDLFDLGEFDQKGSIPTKYGTRDELIELIQQAHQKGMKIYADTVLNHKAGADYEQEFEAVLVDSENRDADVSEPHVISAWTGFNFEGRGNQYSDFKWNFNHFNGVDYDAKTNQTGIFRILGENKYWSDKVSNEKGNYDYLMFADVNLSHPEVIDEIFKWVVWFKETTQVDGLRMDALKHIDADFIRDFAAFCKEQFGPDFYMVGEYWTADEQQKLNYLNAIDYGMDLFDVKLHFNFFDASHKYESYDLRTIFDGTLVSENPLVAVTFVDNHDSQPSQSLSSWVEPWFKPLAYTLILMREEGYPCVFYGDYEGIQGDYPVDGQKEWLSRILKARKQFTYGQRDEYFDDPNLIGWVYHGDTTHPGQSISIINNSPESKTLIVFCGQQHHQKVYYDLLLGNEGGVVIDEQGYGHFEVNGQSAAIWVSEESTHYFD